MTERTTDRLTSARRIRMRDAMRLGRATTALAALLFALVSQATNVAELPLKTSLLAKPNVIFGLDDSGSMDSEVMLATNDGAFWWNYADSNGWKVDSAHPITSLRSVSSPLFNAVGDASSTWRKMVYLFPNGQGTGKRTYGDDANDHFAIAPTPQFAFLRSSDHNPIYYNPLVTYKPWSPAYISAAVSYGNATATAAKAHPVSGTSTYNLAAVRSSTASNEVFTMLPGMRIPAYAKYCNASDSCTPNTDAGSTGKQVTSGKYRASISFWPATYWVKEPCTLDTSDNSGCTTAPNGDTLKRYEIKSGNTFPSGRSHADELQNFANWFTYYRKRKLMLSAAMGETLENLTGMRLGVVVFNNHKTVTMYDTDAASAANNGKRVAGVFYQTDGSGGTPTRNTLSYIGEQYRNTSSVVEYACQRNSAFIVTDGFANASGGSVPGYTQATWGTGAPYQSIFSGTLADIALSYYTLNTRPAMATGRVPVTTADANPNLHMTTYGLTMGARGTLWEGNGTARPTSATAWPNPNQDRSPTSVDDLWHATINGRGQMYTASTPEETALRIQAGLTDILAQVGAQSSLAVSSINLARGDSQAYLGTYNPAGWAGNLTANPIGSTDGVMTPTPNWTASALLGARDWTGRTIATYRDGAGLAFSAANVGSVVNPDGAWGTDAAVVDYLRGNRNGEGSRFRTRTGLLGAVINAEPVVGREDKLVYLASGEGMLHAFDTVTGHEHWAFVPGAVLPNLGQISDRAYAFRSRLDATPTLGKLAGNGKRILVGALGAAGRSYYALDVSAPRNLSEAALASAAMWQFPTSGDAATLAKMGYSYGRPVIGKTSSQGDVVLVTSGYDNATTVGDGKGRLWMLDANTGAVLREFVTTEGTAGGAEAGLSHVSALRESDGTIRHVYGGDLLGNLWHFDLNTGTAVKVAALKDASGTAQPVTAAPELVTIGDKRVILVGTGRLLDIIDFGSSKVQSFYAIADGATVSNARSGLVSRSYNRSGNPQLSGSAVDWSTQRGWYFDLPAGEQANTMPTVAYGMVGFITNVNGGVDCQQAAYLYLVDIGSGLKSTHAEFESVSISTTANASRLTTLRVIDGRLIGTTHTSDNGVNNRALIKQIPIPRAKNAWLEIRR